MKGDPGSYFLEFDVNGNSYEKKVLIDEKMYEPIEKRVKDGTIDTITLSNKKNIALNLFGWKLGWLGTYILFSIAFSIALRKMFKVY